MEIYIRSNIDLIKNMLAIGIEPMTNASPCIPCYWHKSATLPTELNPQNLGTYILESLVSFRPMPGALLRTFAGVQRRRRNPFQREHVLFV